MSWIGKLGSTFRREKLESDVEDELAFHVEQRTRELINNGIPPEEAKRRAVLQMGGVERVREETREADSFVWLETLKRDVLYAAKLLAKAPVFTVTALISILIGIGGNTTVFTITKRIMLDSLPVRNAARLVILHNPGPQEGHISDNGYQSHFSYPLYKDLNGATSAIFDGILAQTQTRVTVVNARATGLEYLELVSGNYFDVLGVSPWRGRLLTPKDDDKPGAHPVAVITYGYWTRALGSDPDAVGRTVTINGHPFQIAGICPPSFYGVSMDSRPSIFVPVTMAPQITPERNRLERRLDHWAELIALLRPGITQARASSALSVLYPPLRDQDLTEIKHPDPDFVVDLKREQVELTPGGQGYTSIRKSLTKPLFVLGALSAAVLLITLVNVANLLIAKGASREREIAVRLSIGASKTAIVRQLLVESILLAFAGGVLGVGATFLCTKPLAHLLGVDWTQDGIPVTPDLTMLTASTVVSLVCGVAFGLLPALQLSRTDTANALKAEGSFGHTSGRIFLRRALVASQIAFSLILLTSALLFTASLRKLQHVDVGFDTANLVDFKINPFQAGYSHEQVRGIEENLRSRLAAAPGVLKVAACDVPLLEDQDRGSTVTVEGHRSKHGDDDDVLRDSVAPGFLDAMKIPLLAGRDLRESDGHNVGVVNKAFVRKYFGSVNPVGRHFTFGSGDVTLDWTIIGVAADNEHSDPRSEIKPLVWEPLLARDDLKELTFYVRTSGSGDAAINLVRNLVKTAYPDVAVFDVETMQERITGSMSAEKGLSVLSAVFAGIAVLLSAIGLYGVVAYSVVRQKREIGIRMALGASRGSVLNRFLSEAAILSGISIACAVPVLIATSRLMASLLYQVSPSNPLVLASAAGLLFAVCLFASLLPAISAARVEPQTALRTP